MEREQPSGQEFMADKPIDHDASATPESKSDIVSPNMAKEWLQARGYPETNWELYLSGGRGSHQLRSFIRIAQGTTSQSLREVYDAERVRDGLDEPVGDTEMDRIQTDLKRVQSREKG